MDMFRKFKIKARAMSGEEAARALGEAHNMRESIVRDLTSLHEGQLPAAVEDLIDQKMLAMEQRMQEFMLRQFEGVAKYTKGNQAMAEVAGMEATGENTLVDAHLSVAGEADFSGDIFAAGQGLLSQPKLTKSEYRSLMNSTRNPASRLLGRLPGDLEN